MTSTAYPSPDAAPRLSYARARLYLGISGVGTSVLIASAMLAFDLPARLLSSDITQPLPEALTALLPVLVGAALLFLPFDILGGAVVVRHRPSPLAFLGRWTRGVAVQLAIGLGVAALLMLIARRGNVGATIVAFALLQLLLATLRAPLARVIAPLGSQEIPQRLRTIAQRVGIAAERLQLVSTDDEGFVGGWSGIVPRRLVLPARWMELSDAELEAVLTRRQIIAASGAHLRGVVGAVAWNTLGFALVLALTSAQLGSAAGLLTVAAGMTLWAFVGVLLLPTPSRAAVFAVDRAAARTLGAAALASAIERLDRWQDDEERRTVGVETVFHPVPSRSARRAPLEATPRDASSSLADRWATHHLARHALWLGWGTLSPISRAVHCNVGRPALWAMLPGD